MHVTLGPKRLGQALHTTWRHHPVPASGIRDVCMSSPSPLTEDECARCLAQGRNLDRGWLVELDSELHWLRPAHPQHAIYTRWIVGFVALAGLFFVCAPFLGTPVPPPDAPVFARLPSVVGEWWTTTWIAGLGLALLVCARSMWRRRERSFSMRVDRSALHTEERFAGGEVRIHRYPWSAVRAFRTGGDGHSTTTSLWIDVRAPTWTAKRSVLVHFSESTGLVRTLKQRLERWQQEHAVVS